MPTLFVYGTLMTGQLRNRYLTEEGAQYLREARTIARYSLFRPLLADYPCLVEDKRQGVSVEGELWEVLDECLKGLDKVEGVPHLFQRRFITLEDGQEVQAYLMTAKPWFARRLGRRWG
jgi:gamma-glutamylaminecyclotransferase